jgi:hypothetical protein
MPVDGGAAANANSTQSFEMIFQGNDAQADIEAGRERIPEEWELDGSAMSLSLGDACDLDPALLAAMLGPDVADLTVLSDDQLTGALQAARRLENRAASGGVRGRRARVRAGDHRELRRREDRARPRPDRPPSEDPGWDGRRAHQRRPGRRDRGLDREPVRLRRRLCR